MDDILITGNNIVYVARFVEELGKLFSMKDLGPLNFFLGVEATHSDGGLYLTQAKYTTDLLRRTKFLDVKPVSTHSQTGKKMSIHDGESLRDASEYRSVVGALQYLTITRPDISYAVNQVRQFMHQPTTTHWTAVKRILRYLKHTFDHGLFYCPSPFEDRSLF